MKIQQIEGEERIEDIADALEAKPEPRRIMIPADQLHADMLVPALKGYETPKIDK